MAKAVDENCASCGKPQSNKGSLTQWVGLGETCQCAVLDKEKQKTPLAAKEETSKDSICKKCGKHTMRSTGSLTQWVFRQDLCDCDENSFDAVLPEDDGSEPSFTFDRSIKSAGEIIARHYEVISFLGAGGTSLVYKARHQFMDRTVAIKVLSPDRIPDNKMVQRFQQEARSVSRLKHQNIVDVHEFGIDENRQPYLIMDYLDGNSLSEDLNENGPMKPSRAAGIFLQISDALQHAHEKGVIHRDLKPSNAILTRDGNGHEQVKLVDFGIAKLNEPENKESALTQTGEIFGSPFYMSPEQCKGHRLDHRSDIYSLGCVMYEMLTGETAAKSGSVVETMMQHINGLRPDFDENQIVRKYSEDIKNSDTFETTHEHKCMTELRRIVESCIKTEPDDRYKTMEALKKDLERLLAGSRAVGGKESAFVWSSATLKKTRADGGAATTKLPTELLPIGLVVIGFLLSIGAFLYYFAPQQHVSKESKPSVDKVAVPKNASHLLIATTANGSAETIENLDEASFQQLKKAGATIIRARNMHIFEKEIKLMSQIPTLEIIDLTGSSGFEQSEMSDLAQLPKLHTLLLGGTDVSDKLSLTLAKLNLQRLDLSYTRFTDAGIKNLMKCRSLRYLRPYKSLVTDDSDKILKQHGWKIGLRDWYEKP